MAVSNVYYTNMRTTLQENLLQKLERLVRKAGMMDMDFENKFTAIKIHFGEPGNLAYLRPNYSKVLVDLIRSKGGRPFLTDCNTLYVGRRKNALDHLDAAYENGYNPFCTGCHMIIADGLKGTDEVLVPIDGGVCEGGQDRPGADGCGHRHFPDPFQGTRVHRLRRGFEEPGHGRRLQSRKDGDAQCRQALCEPGALRGLRFLQKELRSRGDHH